MSVPTATVITRPTARHYLTIGQLQAVHRAAAQFMRTDNTGECHVVIDGAWFIVTRVIVGGSFRYRLSYDGPITRPVFKS